MTVRRDHDDPWRGPSTQPRFDRFPANRILVYLGFYFLLIVRKTSFLGLDLVLLDDTVDYLVRPLIIIRLFVRFLITLRFL